MRPTQVGAILERQNSRVQKSSGSQSLSQRQTLKIIHLAACKYVVENARPPGLILNLNGYRTFLCEIASEIARKNPYLLWNLILFNSSWSSTARCILSLSQNRNHSLHSSIHLQWHTPTRWIINMALPKLYWRVTWHVTNKKNSRGKK